MAETSTSTSIPEEWQKQIKLKQLLKEKLILTIQKYLTQKLRKRYTIITEIYTIRY